MRSGLEGESSVPPGINTAGEITPHVFDTDARQLYYVLPGGKAIRYGVTVGEEALAFSGVAQVGRKVTITTGSSTTTLYDLSGRADALAAAAS